MSSVCKYYLQGRCSFGPKCRNPHDGVPQAQVHKGPFSHMPVEAMQQYHDRSASSQTSGKRNSAQREYADYVQIPDYLPVDVRKLPGLSDRKQRKVICSYNLAYTCVNVKSSSLSFILFQLRMWTFLCPGGITVETQFKFCSYKDQPSYVLQLDNDVTILGVTGLGTNKHLTHTHMRAHTHTHTCTHTLRKVMMEKMNLMQYQVPS